MLRENESVFFRNKLLIGYPNPHGQIIKMKCICIFGTYKHIYVSIITKKEEVVNLRGNRTNMGEVEVRMQGTESNIKTVPMFRNIKSEYGDKNCYLPLGLTANKISEEFTQDIDNIDDTV